MAYSRTPFTDSQWEELENQALVFKYIAANVPVPPHLLFLIRRPYLFSSSSSSSTTFLSPHFGWNVYDVGMGRKIDAEPGRCRRTDGKKWRCSKEASPDSKYCERHMHRGKNRSSRKPLLLPPPPQFSLSSKPSLSLDSSLSSSSRIRRRRSGCMEEDYDSSCVYESLKQRDRECFILGTDLGTQARPLVLDEKREQRDYHQEEEEEEEEERSKKVYRFLDEWPSSKSSVSTSLFF